MTDPLSTEFDTHNVNLKTYNNILKKAIRLATKLIMKQFFYNLRMILEARGNL